MRKPILQSDGGFTLISVLMEGVIIAVAFIGLYIGILYAEATLVENYHNRVAMLHASGELDYQMLYVERHGYPLPFLNKTVTIDQEGFHTLRGTMTMNAWTDADNSTGFASMEYNAVEITVTWKNPSDKKRKQVTLREDYFRKL
jgi:hypothetical protein